MGLHRIIPHVPEVVPEPPRPTLEELRQSLADEHAKAVSEAFERGRQVGYEQCNAELRDEAATVINAALESLQRVYQSLAAPLANIEREIAELVLRLALSIARKIVDYEIEQFPHRIVESLSSIFQEQSEMLGEGHIAEIEIHPDDAEFLPHIQGLALKINPLVGRGGATARIRRADAGEGGVIAEWDARLASRWAEIEGALWKTR